MDALTAAVEDPATADVKALLIRHFEMMRAGSPEESCHVTPPDSFGDQDETLLGVRRDGVLLGIGAIKEIAPGHGELKSMHTAAEARGQGVARVILEALLAEARQHGLTRLSLETGSAEMFAPARTLYESAGFETCPPFGDYVVDPLSVFMTRVV